MAKRRSLEIMLNKTVKKRLLIVDDEQEICEFLADYFNGSGYECMVSLNGEDALAKTKLFRPHVILLDIKMPGIDGIEVLKRIRSFDTFVGVIVVTGVLDEGIGRQALKEGAVDFITKPIDLEYLEHSILAKVVSILT